MPRLGKSASAVWLLITLLCCGCSNGVSKPTSNTKAAAATTDIPDLVAQIRELQAKPLQQGDRAAIIGHLTRIVELSERVLAAKPEPVDRDQAREAALQAIWMMSGADPTRGALLTKVDKLAEDTLADTPDGPMAGSALFARAVTHLNIERGNSETDPAVNKRLFAMAKQFAIAAPEHPQAGQLLFMIGHSALMSGQNDTAMKALRYTVEVDAQGQFGKMAEGKLALLEAIGKPPEIAGPTLTGSEIDISQFAGKVVLVDFWATWCGPCVKELPNVQRVYDKYHDEGFEVIAVSLDRSKDELSKFVGQRKLPWPQIFFDEEGKRFWQNPIGQKYGIDSIPATFLVDRQGNVQKIGVRGHDLEPAVVELLNAAQ